VGNRLGSGSIARLDCSSGVIDRDVRDDRKIQSCAGKRDARRPLESSGWRARSCAARRSCIDGAEFHMTFFEPSYQERDGWSGSGRGWHWAAGDSPRRSSRNLTVNAAIDQAVIGLGTAGTA